MTADQVEGRGFAGAVRANDGVALALRDTQIEIADDADIAEATQSDMAALLGPILFVVIVFGGLGSLPGAFIASLFLMSRKPSRTAKQRQNGTAGIAGLIS